METTMRCDSDERHVVDLALASQKAIRQTADTQGLESLIASEALIN
jgi:hypothetical protein